MKFLILYDVLAEKIQVVQMLNSAREVPRLIELLKVNEAFRDHLEDFKAFYFEVEINWSESSQSSEVSIWQLNLESGDRVVF